MTDSGLDRAGFQPGAAARFIDLRVRTDPAQKHRRGRSARRDRPAFFDCQNSPETGGVTNVSRLGE